MELYYVHKIFTTNFLHSIYFCCSLLLHVSVMNFAHLREATSLFDVCSVCDDILKWVFDLNSCIRLQLFLFGVLKIVDVFVLF
jgi:hypothetical protein